MSEGEGKEVATVQSVKRGLPLLLPPLLRTVPRLPRLIAEYYGCGEAAALLSSSSYLCRMSRLLPHASHITAAGSPQRSRTGEVESSSTREEQREASNLASPERSRKFQNMVHDVYITHEEEYLVSVVLPCGAMLKVPREDLGGRSWEEPLDPNPHSIASISAPWMSEIMRSRRLDEVSDIEVYIGSAPFSPKKGAFLKGIRRSGEDEEKPREASSRRALLTSGDYRGTTMSHSRIRCYAYDESKAAPTRRPLFIYAKMRFPYHSLLSTPAIEDPTEESFLTEAAAYNILHNCNPVVSPTCYFSHFHFSTGTYCIVLEDLIRMQTFPSPVERYRAMQCSSDNFERTLKRVFTCLAALHGRFLPQNVEEAHDLGSGSSFTREGRRLLVNAFAHEKIFYANWKAALFKRPTEDMQNKEVPSHFVRNLQKLYGVSSATGEAVESTVLDSSSLSLIHGNLCSEHIRMAVDPRGTPSVQLVDWKSSGIGPIEVDLIQAFVTLTNLELPKATGQSADSFYRAKARDITAVDEIAGFRKTLREGGLLERMLEEYSTALRIFYRVERSVPYLLRRMCEVTALLDVSSASFGWTQRGRLPNLNAFHQYLSDKATQD